MFQGKRVALIVPAYREERLLPRMLARVPTWVDAVYVIDDASDDATSAAALGSGDPRVRCLRHDQNRGVGAAIVTGYRAALGEGHDLLAVMAGDDQMDPADLPGLLAPIADGRADYVKGNRFVHVRVGDMPVYRRLAGHALSWLTRAASGLDVNDCQCGYTALAARAAAELPLGELWPRYGYPNDLLLLLAERGLRVLEAPVRPVYADEISGVRPWHALTVVDVILRRVLSTRLPLLHVGVSLARGRTGLDR